VIVHGRNVFVHALEERLGAVPGIRDGGCALVQEHGEGRRRISLVAEVTHDGVDTNAMATRLRRLTMEAEGLPVDEVVFVPPGMFPRTPSGKVQRYRCRELVRHTQLGTRAGSRALATTA
jgi:fatty-acyl-CoA synthase